jgi:1-deoxy-D-xylulose-5-phosphate synthase
MIAILMNTFKVYNLNVQHGFNILLGSLTCLIVFVLAQRLNSLEVGFAAGLAGGGLKPVVAIYSTFMQRSYDQIIHDACLQNSDILFALDRAGIVGEDGPTHQGLFDFSYLRHIPNLVVMVPKDENEFQHMIKTATECPVPVAFRYPRGKGEGVTRVTTLESIDIGKGEI